MVHINDVSRESNVCCCFDSSYIWPGCFPDSHPFVLITTNGLSFIDTKQYVTDKKQFIHPDSRGGRTSGEKFTIQNMYILRSS